MHVLRGVHACMHGKALEEGAAAVTVGGNLKWLHKIWD